MKVRQRKRRHYRSALLHLMLQRVLTAATERTVATRLHRMICRALKTAWARQEALRADLEALAIGLLRDTVKEHLSQPNKEGNDVAVA